MSAEAFQPDVVLVRPWSPQGAPRGGLVEDALGVGYLAAALRAAGRTVAVVDGFTLELDDEGLVRAVAQLAPRIVAISLHSFYDHRRAVAVSQGLRRCLPDAYQALGGEQATFTAQEILRDVPSIDAVVTGEGELTLTEISDVVLRGERPERIHGALVRAASGEIVDGGLRAAIEDLDALPMPAKDIVETALLLGRPVALSLLSGRGCTHKCTFCTANTYLRLGGGLVWRRRKPEAVVEEMAWLVDRYWGRPGVHPMVQFQDVIFLGSSLASLQWTQRFADEVERRGLRVPFYIMARAEAILAHKASLRRLASVGLRSVEIGIESGVDRILQAYSKQNSATKLLHAIDLLRENDICYDASGFIMFDPRMTLDEVRQNAHFLRRLGHVTWDRIVTKLQVFPGTAIRGQLIDEGLFDAGAAVDDVYAYRHADPRVGLLARHTFIYSEAVRALDVDMHRARAAIAERTRKGFDDHRAARRAVDAAQDLYTEHFLSMADAAESGRLQAEFLERTTEFLTGVRVLHAELSAALAEPEIAAAAALG